MGDDEQSSTLMLVIKTTTIPLSEVSEGGYSADMSVVIYEVSDPNTAALLYSKVREEIKNLRMMLMLTGMRQCPVPSVSVRIERETV